MDTTHKEIIIWSLGDDEVKKWLGAHLDIDEVALDKILEELVNEECEVGYLFGSGGPSYDVHCFDTKAEAAAYELGIQDAEGWLEARELLEPEIAFLRDCNPCCSDCGTRDPHQFAAYMQWVRQRDCGIDAGKLIFDECDKCREREAVRIEAQKWYFSKEQGCIARAVYTAVADQYDMINDVPNFIPCLAIEGERGYYPMRGSGEGAAPWYWGTTYEECQKTCDDWNEKRYGISPREAAIIVAGTMRRD